MNPRLIFSSFGFSADFPFELLAKPQVKHHLYQSEPHHIPHGAKDDSKSKRHCYQGCVARGRHPVQARLIEDRPYACGVGAVSVPNRPPNGGEDGGPGFEGAPQRSLLGKHKDSRGFCSFSVEQEALMAKNSALRGDEVLRRSFVSAWELRGRMFIPMVNGRQPACGRS